MLKIAMDTAVTEGSSKAALQMTLEKIAPNYGVDFEIVGDTEHGRFEVIWTGSDDDLQRLLDEVYGLSRYEITSVLVEAEPV